MSILNTTIQRPYFGGNKYPRVINTNFRELTKSSSTSDIEKIIKEYKRLKYNLPADIHNLIYLNSSRALGKDPEEENFEKIDKLNHILDNIEAESTQQITAESREHPHFRNGTFITGYTYYAYNAFDEDRAEDYPVVDEYLAYYFMQKGHKRQIESYELFKILYTLVNKREAFSKKYNVLDLVPKIQPEELLNIPLAAPINSDTLGSETKFTNIFKLPNGYFDRSDLSQVIKAYGDENNLTPEEVEIKFQSVKKAYNLYGGRS